jgi:hypothetical protein
MAGEPLILNNRKILNLDYRFRRRYSQVLVVI